MAWIGVWILGYTNPKVDGKQSSLSQRIRVHSIPSHDLLRELLVGCELLGGLKISAEKTDYLGEGGMHERL
jgi:hypothetical protein